MTDGPSLFVFGENTFSHRGFTWAASIHPRSEVINQICDKCGYKKHYLTGGFDVTLEKGSKYPDVLGCGAYPFLIVSNRVIQAWQQEGISCYHTYDVNIAQVKSPKLKDVPAPQYYRVEIDGSCMIDLEASGAKVVKFCPACHHLEASPTLINGFRMVSDSWDGSALFRDQVHFPMVTFCTETIVKIASQYRLTNFRFEPMEGPLDPGNKGINYLTG